jgi:hypothetical protein
MRRKLPESWLALPCLNIIYKSLLSLMMMLGGTDFPYDFVPPKPDWPEFMDKLSAVIEKVGEFDVEEMAA